MRGLEVGEREGTGEKRRREEGERTRERMLGRGVGDRAAALKHRAATA
jgi:hypothetical protein